MNKDIVPIEKRPHLWDWLCKHDARCVWQQRVHDSQYECWRVGAGLVIAVLYPGDDGWDLYSMHPSNSVPETLADAEKRLGLSS